MTERKRDWCFTVHGGHFGDRTEDEVIEDLLETACKYIVFQQEAGGQLGRDHLQGYVMFATMKSRALAQKELKVACHLEPRRSPKISEAVDYCKKEDTRRPGCEPFEKGQVPMDTGVKRTLVDACELVKSGGSKKVAQDMPDVYVRYHKGLQALEHIHKGDAIPQKRDVLVYYVWGDSGCGKSHFAEHFGPAKETYSTGDMKDHIWFGAYTGQKILIIEEFESLCGASIMKRMLDGYKMEVQTKGGMVWAEWEIVVITSNYDPCTQYDARVNPWTGDGTVDGPFQRRFKSGGVHHGVGVWEAGTAVFTPPLPAQLVVRGAVDLTEDEPTQAVGDISEDDSEVLAEASPGTVPYVPETPMCGDELDDLLRGMF